MTRLLCILFLWSAVFSTGAAPIIPGDSVWKYFKGETEASSPDPTAWREAGFEDASWSAGQAPFYYESSPGSATDYTGNTDLPDMDGGYACVFLRAKFFVSNVAEIARLQFKAMGDDGFIAWINGVEITRFNMPAGAVAFDGTALPALGEPVPVHEILLENPEKLLRTGTNVLAIQAFNSSLGGSSDFLIWADLSAPPNSVWSGIGISEFMATNQTTVVDVDGDAPGWIEPHNPTDNAFGLSGWALTSDTNNLRQWVFPNIVLPAHDFVVVFASGKNRNSSTAELHTNFKLPSGGGFLALVDPSGSVVSSFAAYPPQTPDVSYGRDMLLADDVGPFPTSTPGDPNTMGGAGAAPEVVFSRSGGAFVARFDLELSAASNAVIRYTLDGASPDEDSPEYMAAIPVTGSLQVRARAFLSGLRPGALRSETYLQLGPGLEAVTSDLPAIVLYNHGAGDVPVDDFQRVDLAFYEPGDGLTRLTNAATFSTRAGIHLRGSSTLGISKHAYSVEFRDELDNDSDLSPLGLPADSDWVLYAPNNFDPVLLHNPLIYELSNAIGRYAPRTRFVEVYLNTTGGPLTAANYVGIYVLEEKIKWGKDRVPVTKIRSVDKLHPLDNSVPNVTGGYMMKIDRFGPGESGFGAAGQQIVHDYPDETEIKTPQRAPQKQHLQTFMNAFGSALNGAGYANPTDGFRAYVDAPSWIDSHILNVTAFNVDALRLSAYFHKDRDGLLEFGPIWDFDRTQGSTDGRDFNPRRWRSTQGDRGTDFFNYPWWGRMFTDLEFWQAWIDRYQQLRADVLSTNNIFTRIDALAGQVRRQQPREVARWSGLTRPRSGSVSIDGYAYSFNGTYQGEVNFLKKWYADRLRFMDTNFVARPVFGHNGGGYLPGTLLSLESPESGTIYFTRDGSDPRASGGGVSSQAVAYAGPILLSPGLSVRARVLDPSHRNLTGANNPPLSSPWSGPMAATFFEAVPPAISTGLRGLDAYVGQTPTFAFSVTGSPEPTYLWKFNGGVLPGQTNAALTLSITQAGQSGTYTLTATNGVGGAETSFVLNVTPRPVLAITEVQSSESKGSADSTLDHQDWWEMTNLGDFPVNLQGFRFDDDHGSLTNAQTLTNAVIIAPGESVVLVQEMTPAQFVAWWGSAKLPPQLKILAYSNVGFGADRDAIYLWNAAATSVTDTVASVTFGLATRGVTFRYDPGTKLFGGPSAVGRDGAFAAAVNGDVGSPGTIISPLRLAGPIVNQRSALEFGFATQPGWQYAILYKEDLADPAWLTLTNFFAPSDSFLFSDPIDGRQPKRFYRIKVTP
jgi:hypothetical protein